MAGYERHGIALVHAWGMTETSPLGCLARRRPEVGPEEALRYKLTQDGSPLPWRPG